MIHPVKMTFHLKSRTDLANEWGADVLVSIHHNAYVGKWGTHGGVETYTYPGGSQESLEIANDIHPLVVKAMGLRDRGLKLMNFHMLRESRMPAILIEGGFMDSSIDILALRDSKKLTANGEAIASGIVNYYNLKLIGGDLVEIVYKYGDTGPAVGLIQKNLNKLGYNLVLDNSFGPIMLNAVKDFQKKNGLAVDGFVGPLTQLKISNSLKEKDLVYRVIVDGKQIGAYTNPTNITNEVLKAVMNGVSKIEDTKKISSIC